MVSESTAEPTTGARRRAASPSARGRNRWLLIGALAGLVLLAIVSAGIWLAVNPILAAYLCPSCFGFQNVAGQVWVEPRLTAAERRQLTTDLAEARKRVSAMYGAVEAQPVVLVCGSDDCDRRIGGKGARGATYGWHVVRIAPRGRSAAVLAHELAHAELHQRIGWWGLMMGTYPAWFDEGLAVLVSRDTRILDFSRVSAPRCRVVMSDADVAKLPRTSAQWSEQMWKSRDLYERAGCAVARWYQSAGRQGVMALVEDVRGGRDFDAAFAARKGRP